MSPDKLWNMASYRQRTPRVRAYKPVAPVGDVGNNDVNDCEHCQRCGLFHCGCKLACHRHRFWLTPSLQRVTARLGIPIFCTMCAARDGYVSAAQRALERVPVRKSAQCARVSEVLATQMPGLMALRQSDDVFE